MALSIRPATPADRDFLGAMAERLADFDAPPIYRPPAEIAAGDRRDLWRALDDPPPGSVLVVAELDGKPAGCLHILTKLDFFTERPHAHVSVIAVARNAEGKGVARELMAWAERWADEQGYGHVTLNVFPANTRARALYDRSGYALDMLTMRKDLAR